MRTGGRLRVCTRNTQFISCLSHGTQRAAANGSAGMARSSIRSWKSARREWGRDKARCGKRQDRGHSSPRLDEAGP